MYLNERGNSISQGQTRTDKENWLITPKSPPMSAPTLSRSMRKESGLISSTKLLDSHPPSLSSTSDGGSKSLSSSLSSSWHVSGPNLRIFVNKIAEITRKQFEDEGKQHSDDVCEREVTTNSNKQEIDSQTRVPSLHLLNDSSCHSSWGVVQEISTTIAIRPGVRSRAVTIGGKELNKSLKIQPLR